MGSNPAYYALLSKNLSALQFFVHHQISPISSSQKIFQDLKGIIQREDEDMLRLFLNCGLNDVKNYKDYDNTNLGVNCLRTGKRRMFEVLREQSNLNVHEENFQGESCQKLLNNCA